MKTGLIFQKMKRQLSRFSDRILLITPLLVLAFMISGSTIIYQSDPQKENVLISKRLNLLEKLEAGNKVTPEEMKALFPERRNSEIQMEEIHFNIEMGIGDLKDELRSFSHSEEFNDFKEEIRKMGEDLKREMMKLSEQIEKAVREEKINRETHIRI